METESPHSSTQNTELTCTLKSLWANTPEHFVTMETEFLFVQMHWAEIMAFHTLKVNNSEH
ncbi:hypothetical protein DPMN_078591 [Dreissena polymorpha]|uniref:Uncharacterized protein n=1 Tax=Dreissena polymorpha TaxID=45954 RepID=A0A9D3YRH6_DREPO|nr:hypothetical protein DPMN_078591 [Dreissena polymorpha]